jgi:ATP-dependent Clp protease adapter protein ClpS
MIFTFNMAVIYITNPLYAVMTVANDECSFLLFVVCLINSFFKLRR